MSRRKYLVVADIYCGAGGLSAGFAQAKARWPGSRNERFKIAYGVDNDEDAIHSFRTFHFPGLSEKKLRKIALCKDIADVKAQDILRAIRPFKHVDVLIGGPNCQGVSAAGLRNPDDDRNKMLLAFIDLVRDLRPYWFIMENVPGLTHINNRELLAEIFKRFEDIKGYKVAGEMLLAADYGVPQFRYRLFIIGTNTGRPIRFPIETHTEPLLDGQEQTTKNDLPEYKDVEYAICNLLEHEPRALEKNELPNGSLRNRQPVFPSNHYCLKMGEENRQRIASILPGQDWRDMPLCLLPERFFATRASDQKGAYGRLLWKWPAYTITNAAYNVTAGPFTHPQLDRSISVREAARLQSFSDRHIFFGNIISQYRQVGNAVPPKLARAVAETILYSHFWPSAVINKNWGRTGRLSFTTIRASLDGKEAFPTLTPRMVHPLFNHRPNKQVINSPRTETPSKTAVSIWDSNLRVGDLDPEDVARLRKIAKQPANYRAAKRAKAIVQFIDGEPKEIIVRESNKSEANVKRWVDQYFHLGLEGWRAYHKPTKSIAGRQTDLIPRIEAAIKLAREIVLTESNNCSAGKQPKRLYMNEYILELIRRFGNKSVSEMIGEVGQVLENGVGTVYVGDLLAIYDVVVSRQNRTEDLD